MSERIEIVILGTGAGQTHVYAAEPSSSFALLVDGEPKLLADIGSGVTSAYLTHVSSKLPDTLYVSHNHTDHAGELPVVLAVERSKGRRLRLLAQRDVMTRLLDHRLHELQSTGCPPEHFAELVEVPDVQDSYIPVCEGITARAVRTRHAELCYGLILYAHGRPLLGWTADSGDDARVFQQLSEAPVLLVDARTQSTSEHASFAEIAALTRTSGMEGRQVYLTGYGRQNEAPSGEVLEAVQAMQVVRPGQRITLQTPAAPKAKHASTVHQAVHATDESKLLTSCH